MVNIVAEEMPGISAPAEVPPPDKTTEIIAGPVAKKGLRVAEVLPILAVALAVFGCTLSAVGLAMTSRTVAEARLAIEDLKHAPGAPATGERHEARAPSHAAPAAAGATATADLATVNQSLIDLRSDIARLQSANGATLAPLVRDGQTELVNRMSEITAKIDRIDRALAARQPAATAGR